MLPSHIHQQGGIMVAVRGSPYQIHMILRSNNGVRALNLLPRRKVSD